MRIVFIGYAIGFDEMNGCSGVSVAGNKMQVNILKELLQREDVELEAITVYPIASFPRSKKIYVKSGKTKLFDDFYARVVPFINVPVIKQIHQIITVCLAAARITDKDTKILTFNLFPQIGVPAVWLKNKKKARIFSILADLPIDDRPSRTNPIRNGLRKIFDATTKDAIKQCDNFIVLNRHVSEMFFHKKPFIVVEGGIDKENIPEPGKFERKTKNIVYGGTLTEYSGISALMEAMKYVDDPEVVLEIYGNGPLKKTIIDISAEQKNIRYCGLVSNEEMLKIQRAAYLLINPRPTEDPIAQVSFPSKIFEYMTSGTPVLATKLNCFDGEYSDKMFFCDDTPESMSEEINRIFSLDKADLEEMAGKAYEFVTENKTWNVQVDKIYGFLQER